jgi:hypothetical protein
LKIDDELELGRLHENMRINIESDSKVVFVADGAGPSLSCPRPGQHLWAR